MNELFSDGYYCTTTDILSFCPDAASLCYNPTSPDFSNQIYWVSREIRERIKAASKINVSTDLLDPTQLKLIVIHGVLALLYDSAVIRQGSAAREVSNIHRATMNDLIGCIAFDLINGQKINMSCRLVRG